MHSAVNTFCVLHLRINLYIYIFVKYTNFKLFFPSSSSTLIQEYSFLGTRAQDPFWCAGSWLWSSYRPMCDLLPSMSETGEAHFLLIWNTRGTLAVRLISQLVCFMDKAAEIMATPLGISQGLLEGVTVSWLAVCFLDTPRAWQPFHFPPRAHMQRPSTYAALHREFMESFSASS